VLYLLILRNRTQFIKFVAKAFSVRDSIMLTLFVTKKQMTEASVRYFYSLNDHYQNYKSCPQVFWYRFYICPNIKIKNRFFAVA